VLVAGSAAGDARSASAQEREAQRLYETRQMTVEQIARAVGSSPTTVYRYLKLDGVRH